MAGKTLRYLQQHHVALLALFFALGGTAYAASLPRNSVGSAQLKKNAVTSSKVKNGSLRSADFRAGDAPTGARGPAGPAGPQGVAGPTGARGERGPSDAYGSFFGDQSISDAAVSTFELGSQSLPAGSFIASANFIVESSAADTGPRSLTCGLYFEGESGNVAPGNSLDYAEVRLSPGERQTVSMSGPLSQDSAGAFAVTCFQNGQSPGAGLDIRDIDIGAVQVGAFR
jgi:hypothetical protein